MVLYLTEGLITEFVSSNEVSNAIQNREAILITYDDETSKSRQGVRYIEPYVFGATKTGNPCIRAYQYWGDTRRGVPKWKLFRLDRIQSWEPTGEVFELEPKARGWAAQAYNHNGDNSMSDVYLTVDLGEEKPLTDYERLKAKTRQLQTGRRVNINQINPNQNIRQSSVVQQPQKANGPINNNTNADAETQVKQSSPVDITTKSQPQSPHTQPENTKTEPTQKVEGPINDKEQTTTLQTNPTTNSTNPMSDDEFRKMIQRNLEITQKEKEKRNQRKFGNKQM